MSICIATVRQGAVVVVFNLRYLAADIRRRLSVKITFIWKIAASFAVLHLYNCRIDRNVTVGRAFYTTALLEKSRIEEGG